jgi:hypothetical protein
MATQRKFATKPDSIKVGHRTYKVLWLLSEEWKAHDLEDDHRGLTDHAAQVIHVRLDFEGSEAHKDMLQEVLTHEVLHCVVNTSMMWNMWEATKSERDDFPSVEEWFVGIQAPLLVQIYHDNPEYMKWVLS